MSTPSGAWSPTVIRRFVRSVHSSTEAIEAITDQGPAFIKALGNRGGPHLLACELVGTQLAEWFGLRTFDYAVINVTAEDELPFNRGGTAEPGPAFITRREQGTTWSGSDAQLKLLVNPEDIPRLVVFDTWTLNKDRYPPNSSRKPNWANVFLSREGAPKGKYSLKAIDHTHCFTCGSDLTRRIADIGCVKNPRVYGRFPQFAGYMTPGGVSAAVQRLSTLSRDAVERIVSRVPHEWQVPAEASAALVRLIVDRAEFVATLIASSPRWPELVLPLS